MILNDGTSDRESHAHATGLRGVEGLKDPDHRVLGPDLSPNLPPLPAPGPGQCSPGDHQLSRPVFYTAHRVHCIHDQEATPICPKRLSREQDPLKGAGQSPLSAVPDREPFFRLTVQCS
jgi:hypothetical protein